MKQAEANIIFWQANEDDKDMEVTQTEETVKDDQPIKEGFASSIHGKNDHRYICAQYKSTSK